METIQKKSETSTVMTFPYSDLSPELGGLEFEIMGQTNERSFEDRSVFFKIKNTPIPEETNLTHGEVDVVMWLRAENAIEFGLKLIEHGKFAMESNMINHQAIHMNNQYKKFLEEGRVEEVEFTMIDEAPANYGPGFRSYLIKPYWNEGMAPEYQEDFTLERVIYWSPFEQEFADQLDYFTGGCSYSFIGYDHDVEVERFKESVRLMSGD